MLAHLCIFLSTCTQFTRLCASNMGYAHQLQSFVYKPSIMCILRSCSCHVQPHVLGNVPIALMASLSDSALIASLSGLALSGWSSSMGDSEVEPEVATMQG